MINGHDLYAIMTAMVPLYITMILAYGSVKWWHIFTPDQCSGLNRFVAIFAVPLLSFHFISTSNPYAMNLRFIAADTLQKLITLFLLSIATKFSSFITFDWMITIFSLSTLPNSLVIGIPLLTAMYGEFSAALMVQVVVMQCIVWYTLLLFMFEFRAAKVLITEKFPGVGKDIVSFHVESDVVSLDAQDFIETSAEVGHDGKLHVTLRKSNASRRSIGVGSLSGMEIYSLSSSAVQTPRGSYFNQSDINSVVGFPGGRLSNFGPADDLYSIQSCTPRPSNYGEDGMAEMYVGVTNLRLKGNHDDQMFARSSSAPIGSKGGRGRSKLHAMAEESNRLEKKEEKETRVLISGHHQNSKPRETKDIELKVGGDRERLKPGVDSVEPIMEVVPNEGSVNQMPSASVMSRLILMMVSRKLFRNPNTYASLIGLVWALVSFRWNLEMPKIVGNSISLISKTGLGMAMFSLGLFMALQPKLVACRRSEAVLSIVVKFLIGPLVTALAAFLVHLHGTLFHIAIIQATLSVGIVPFVFAKEYDVHATILSTSVIFGMLITVPITICYYIVLQL